MNISSVCSLPAAPFLAVSLQFLSLGVLCTVFSEISLLDSGALQTTP